MTLHSGTRLGPYEILAPAGSGGMGEVYRARDTRLDRLVAVKVLPGDIPSPQAFERFEREAKAIAALNHPGICAIYDVGTSPVPYLVMELLDGETLHERLLRGPVDVAAFVETGLALADALAAAHAKGIIHRDLKPSNIFVTAHGPKIVDFGLARVTETVSRLEVGDTAVPTQAPLTDAGVAVGTTAYMSPEQLRGDALDVRTDLFSLGLVFYEMATGRRAFAGATAAVTSAAILHEQPIAPRQFRPDLPLRLEETILALLEKNRDVRTQTASEIRAVLTRLKRELSGSREPETSAPVASAVSARHRSTVAIAVAVLLAAVLGVAYFVKLGTPVTEDLSGLTIDMFQPEQLTTSGTADAPAISPDGKSVVYVERGSGQDNLRVRQVATEVNLQLVPHEPGTVLRGATFTPNGEFVYYVKQVEGQAFDLWQVSRLAGTPQRLLEAGRVSFSPRGDRMAWVRTVGTDRAELVVASSDGTGEKILAPRQSPKRFWPVAPAWSPDGATIALFGGMDGESATGQIVFVDVASGSERTTADKGPTRQGAGMAWIDDDTLLASMLDKPSAPIQLWLVSFPGGKFRQLTNDTSQLLGVSVTADRSAFVTARAEYPFSIWTKDATATKWRQVGPTRRSKGSIGNTVRWIGDDLLYVSSSSRGFALSRWRASTQAEEILAQGGGNPSVTRDGSTIFFLDYDSREFLTIDATGKRVRIRRADLFPEAAHVTPDGRYYVTIDTRADSAAIFRTTLDRTNKSDEITADQVRFEGGVLAGGRVEVSPDGQKIAYPSVDEGNQPIIAVCDFDACSSRQMFPARARWRWMPNSKALAYVDPKTRSDLWVQPLDRSVPPHQLTHFAADGHEIWDFDWSADGRLAVARGKTSTDIVLYRRRTDR